MIIEVGWGSRLRTTWLVSWLLVQNKCRGMALIDDTGEDKVVEHAMREETQRGG